MATKKSTLDAQEHVGAAEEQTIQTAETSVKKPAAKRTAKPKATEAEAPAAEEAAKPAARKRAVKKEAAEAEAPAVEEAAKPAPRKRTVKKAEPEEAAEAPVEEAAPKKRATKKAAAEEPAAVPEAPEVAPAAAGMAAPAAETAAPTPQAAAESVDFSDEDAALAAEAPEFDLGDEHEQEEVQEGSEDLLGKTKQELVDLMSSLLESKPVQTLRRDVEAIKIAFYKLHRAEVEALRKAFVEAGGVEEEFAAAADYAESRLKELFSEYRRRRDEFLATLEHKKEDNLKVKLRIIEDLKELINSSETINHTFNAFRELQQRWRDTGPVPLANNKDLWETYNLHVENFYGFIKINKELRDLDLRKNYESKLALCEEAEALILEPSVVNAFHKLQKLHEQWRETGPVANEYKETLWERFREASSRINKTHQDHFEGVKDEQKRNLELKTQLCVRVEELAERPMTSRKEWNRASDELIEVQKVWKTLGFAPKKDNTKVYERFRKACDRFFELKRGIYMQMKGEMDLNLQLKQEICAQAEALAGSEEWKKGTDELIAMQKRWKEIGPVPRRYSDAIWKRFRAACDDFFNRKSSHFSSVDSEHDTNLRLKQELLSEIEAAGTDGLTFDDIKAFQRRWSEIGFVPIRHKDSIQKQYKRLMDNLFAAIRGSEGARQMDRFRDRVVGLKTSGDKRLRFERERLYNKVKQLEADIALLENNIGFFAKSKNAESMIRDVNEKIRQAREEMAATIEKVNLIDAENENA